MIPLSPSNMMTYRECPRRFYGQSVAKDIVWKPSKQKLRGTAVHKFMERLVKEGVSPDAQWDPQIDAGFVRAKVESLRGLAASEGYEILTEHPMALDSKMEPCGFWDEGVLLRCRADAVAVPPDESDKPLILVDFKTGRKWDGESFQLRAEAMIAMAVYGVRSALYSYWYVDAGETTSGCVVGIPPDAAAVAKEMLKAMKAGYYPPRKNRFCKWCDYWQTPKCGA